MASGLAAHLNLRVGLVRWLFVLMSPLAGAGLALYVFLWLSVPTGDPADPTGSRPATLTRLARRQTLVEPGRRLPVTDIGVGLLLVVGAILLVAARLGAAVDASWVLPALLVVAGLGLAWSQLDGANRDRLRERAGGARR
ncbi:PspC domain-containing protein [Cellulomonas soli]